MSRLVPAATMRRAVLLLVVPLLGACIEGTRPQVLSVPVVNAPKPPESGFAVYLTLSNDSPRIGDRVTVTARAVAGAQAPVLGSFLVRVTYDSAQLHVLEPSGSREGMVVINPANGNVAAAGASSTGFRNGELFRFTLDVKDPIALRTLSIDARELVSLKFGDQRSGLLLEKHLVRTVVP
jgi:hypothetical protein